MRIAFLSFEFPPETAHGGISTYTAQAADLLADCGHEVEVFAGGADVATFVRSPGVRVHTVGCLDNCRFGFPAGHAFARRHAEAPFDVLEAPEYQAEAEFAIRFAPEIPLVVRMHSPSALLARINTPRREWNISPFEAWPQIRMFAGALRRGEPLPDLRFSRAEIVRARAVEERELAVARQADEVVSPSHALREYAVRQWRLSEDRVAHLPNPFVPPGVLLDVPPAAEDPTVGFFGRLEVRKGILTLCRAIPRIAKAVPSVRFVFVGKSTVVDRRGTEADSLMGAMCARLGVKAEFPGRLPACQLPHWLAAARVAVFPSIWENFPYVCLEAMAAGRAVVGSSAGGMSDMIAPGRSGLLADPGDADQLAERVIHCLGDVNYCRKLGRTARESVLARYSAAVLLPQIEASYLRAIKRRLAAGPRKPSWSVP